MNRVRGKSLICMATVLMLVVINVLPINIGYGSPSPSVSIDPANPVYNTGQSFTVDIEVTDAPEIEAWSLMLRWDPGILKFPTGVEELEGMIGEGPFLNSSGPTHLIAGKPNLPERYVLFTCSLKSNVSTPPSGSGILANFTFTVIESGVTDIDILEAELLAYDTATPVAGVTVSGAYFYTNTPFVDFEWTPLSPEPNEVCTFNASACWDPDGGDIATYSWDFGDGNTTATSSPIITHKFASYNYTGYVVNLTVTDTDPDVWFKVKTLRMWHDLVAADIWPTLDYIDSVHWEADWSASGHWVELWFLCTIINMGTYEETFNATLYADLDEGTIGDERVINWRYPGFGEWLENQNYMPLTLAAGAGSGWWPFFGADLCGWTPGNYTLTLVVTEAPGEATCGTTANNVYTAAEKLEVTAVPSWSYGDVNFDGKVTITDIVYAMLLFGGTEKDWVNYGFDYAVDLNFDLKINIVDLVMIAINFGYPY